MSVNQHTPHRRRSTSQGWAWTEHAMCRGEDTTLFFGDGGESGPDKDAREREAKALCGGCPVRAECLDQALREAPQYGIWGGMTADERTDQRRSILRRKRPAA